MIVYQLIFWIVYISSLGLSIFFIYLIHKVEFDYLKWRYSFLFAIPFAIFLTISFLFLIYFIYNMDWTLLINWLNSEV